jgi:hypothetical protein
MLSIQGVLPEIQIETKSLRYTRWIRTSAGLAQLRLIYRQPRDVLK